MKSLRVEMKFRNAKLYEALLKKFPRTGKSSSLYGPVDFKTALGELWVSAATLFGYLNLTRSPFTKRKPLGGYRASALIIAAYFKIPSQELFPSSLYDLEIPEEIAIELDPEQFLPLSAANFLPVPADFENSQMLREDIDEVLKTLKPSQELVIRKRFGLDGSQMGLAEIGTELLNGVCRERVRQIEKRAIIKLRRPICAKKLRPYLYPKSV